MRTLGKIDHIHITVSDIPNALSWYQRVLGLSLDLRYRHLQEGEKAIWMISNPSGTVRLAVSQDKKLFSPSEAVIAFVVSGQDFLEWIDQLAGERVANRDGLTIARDCVCDYGFFCALAFSDPYGNLFEIVSYDHTWLAGKLKIKRNHA